MKHGKKYNDSRKAVDSAKQYASDEALSLVCTNAKAKFDETIEAHIRLGVDSRHADQQVRGAVVLPNGTGKRYVSAYSARKTSMRQLRLQAQTMSAVRTWLTRSPRKTGWIST